MPARSIREVGNNRCSNRERQWHRHERIAEGRDTLAREQLSGDGAGVAGKHRPFGEDKKEAGYNLGYRRGCGPEDDCQGQDNSRAKASHQDAADQRRDRVADPECPSVGPF